MSRDSLVGDRHAVRARSVAALLSPRSVAVIGASADVTKRGHQAVRALLEDGFDGAVHPVNPRGGMLLGLPVARSVADLPAGVDLALICTPAETVPDLIESCSAAGVHGAVVLALGFGEIGGEGTRLDARLRAAITRSGIRVIGPNTSGIANPWVGLNLIGVGGLRPGGLALLAQSGNVLLGLLLEAQRRPAIGLSCCIGVGNAVDVGLDEYLGFLADDERTRVIALYAEGIGDGRSFLDAAARAAARKPVVLLKGGRSSAGVVAARSHTGVLAGEYAVLRSALREVGVLEVDRADELFPVAETLLTQPAASPGSGIAILSDSGGHATLAADRLAALDGARLAVLDAACERRLRERLGAVAAVANPVDVAGAADRDPAVFVDAAAALLAAEDVGVLLVVGLFGGYAIRFAAELEAAELAAARSLARAARVARKAIVVHSLYADAPSAALEVLRAEGVPVHGSLESACRGAAALLGRRRDITAATGRSRIAVGTRRNEVDSQGADGRSVRAAQRLGSLLEPDLRDLVQRHGVELAPARYCTTAAHAAAVAADYGARVAIRAVAHGVSHKTEVGGVRLDVDAAEAASAFDELRLAVESLAAHAGGAVRFTGVLVGPMLPRPVAELLVGVRTDAVFGTVLAIGAGGTAVELLRDIVLRVPPLAEDDVLRMLDELRIAPLLHGYRGAQPADRRAVARTALALLDCAAANPQLAELELNPLFVYAERAIAVDVRAFSTARAAAPTPPHEAMRAGSAAAIIE